MILLLAQNRDVRRNHWNTDFCATFFGEQFIRARFRRRQQNSGRGIRRVFQTFVAAEHADQPLYFVVIGCEIFVIKRPVNTQSVAAARLEIILAHAERKTSPVIRAATQHARTPPHEILPRADIRGAGLHPRVGAGPFCYVRLTRHAPTAANRRIKKSKRFIRRGRTAQRCVMIRAEHRCFGNRIVAPTRFEHQHLHAGRREHIGGLPAGRARADDDNIIIGLRFGAGNERHDFILWKK